MRTAKGFNSWAASGVNRTMRVAVYAAPFGFLRAVRGESIVDIAKCTGEKGMTRAPHAAQINLCFGNAAREFLDFRASVRSGHFARECLNFLRQSGVDKNGQA
jgi:hypothetical protein